MYVAHMKKFGRSELDRRRTQDLYLRRAQGQPITVAISRRPS